MKNNTNFRISGIRLPMTMDLNEWGKQFYSQVQGSETILWIKKHKSSNIYQITQSPFFNKVNVIQPAKGEDNILISFTDTRKEGDPLNTFTRSVNLPYNKVYIFEDGIKIKNVK